MDFKNFYGVSAADSQPKPEMNFPPTVLRVPTPDGDMVDVLVEAQEDPSSVLDYDDYSITNLLKAGIQPRALHVKADRRLGSDADIEAFNARVDALADKMFNIKDE